MPERTYSDPAEVVFHGIGADPEMLFVNSRNNLLVPAQNLVIKSQGYVGCDGHSTTGELRPPPAKSVHVLLHKIGHALVETQKALPEKVNIVAIPYSHSEPLGGHIHLSYFYKHQEYQYSLAHGWVDHLGHRTQFTAPEFTGYVRSPGPLHTSTWATKVPSPGILALVLAHLIAPLENVVQPSASKAKRLSSGYGGLLDVRSDGRISRPKNQREGWGYCKIEYRHPSTWLWHPMIAYMYLAMAKTAVLSWDFLASQGLGSGMAPLPRPEEAKTGTLERLKSLSEAGVKLTDDVKELPVVIERSQELVSRYQESNGEVQIKSWQKYMEACS